MNFNSNDLKHNDVSTKIKVYMGDLDCPENEYNLTMQAQESGGGLTFNKMDSTGNNNAYEAKFNLPKGTSKFEGFKNTYLIIEVKSLKDFDNTSLTIKLEADGRNFLFNKINDLRQKFPRFFIGSNIQKVRNPCKHFFQTKMIICINNDIDNSKCLSS